MENYRLILVGDEAELRQGILRRTDWAAYGYTVMGAASDGQSGLTLAQKVRPDVVLASFRLPLLGGLEMSRCILRDAPHTKFILLTEEHDLRRAIQTIPPGCVSLLPQPVEDGILQQTLLRLHEQMDSVHRSRHRLDDLRQRYEQGLPLMRTQFLRGLLQHSADTAEITAQAKQYGISLDTPYWAVALIQCDRQQNRSLLPYPEFIPDSLLEQIAANLAGSFSCEVFPYGSNVAILLRLSDPACLTPFADCLGHLCRSTQQLLPLYTTAGIGCVVEDCRSLFHSGLGAARALEYRTLLGTGRAILIDDLESDCEDETTLETQLVQYLTNGLLACDEAALSDLDAASSVSPRRLYAAQIAAEFVRLIRACHMDESCDADSPAEDADPMWTQLSVFCRRLRRTIRSVRCDSPDTITARACAYIQEHYMECDLSVDRLCEILYVSPSYFSTVFKRESGENFIPYLTRVRMEKAAELLRSTPDKTYQIAEKVGFSEPNYFSYVFKKHFGRTPSQYREKNGKSTPETCKKYGRPV